ncbi:MAG: hypothetical protein IPJ19_11645 [Planctomycetes bacterium]|nr:hypothetical protein [Planctomycetota bacterium]
MVVIRTGRIEFQSGTGSRTYTQMVYFPGQLIQHCSVGLNGYRVAYSSGDHELRTIEVDLDCSQQKSEFGFGVAVAATLLLRDKNGDDPFEGWVDYVLFVELHPQPANLDAKTVNVSVVIR